MLLLDILARTNRQIKDIQTEKEEAKLSYSDDMILYTENPKALTKLLTKKWVQQGCSIRLTYKNQLYFFYTLAMDNMEMKFKKQFQLQ